ncbi:MAG: PD40 domain-containing protein [Bacteroidales bacterium]|nr:PD40 domain-containing protein [Bacteroidales bacterium]
MMKHLRLFLMVAALLAFVSPAFAQEVTRERQLAEADALFAGYDFAEALRIYHTLLPGADSAQAVALGAQIMRCENGLNLLKFATEPELISLRVVPLNDFYLNYAHLPNRTWIPFPNDFVPEGQHPFCNALQFDRQRGEVVYSCPDSAGRWNLWTSHLQGDTIWTLPQPLGDAFTSAGDEIYPILSPDGRQLCFSSNGMAGMGGYDLFICNRKPDGSWDAPQNVGFPYSSTADDFLFSPTPDGLFSIFASTRDCPAGSIRLYAVRREHAPVRESVETPAEALRIAAFEKRPEPEPTPVTPDPQPVVGDNEMMTRYFRAVDSLGVLQKQVAELTRELAELREDLREEEDPARKAEITRRIGEKEAAQLVAQAAQSRQMRTVRRHESGFLELGLVPPPILQAKPEPEPEVATLPAESLYYNFRRMEYGLLGDLAIEMPAVELEEPAFDYTFKIGTEAVFAPENKRPEGLIYQIQICSTAGRISKARLKGMSPCFEFKNNGKYVYFVGAFRHYDEAVAALPKVKARGWSTAFITARMDGKALTIKNARAIEAKTKN